MSNVRPLEMLRRIFASLLAVSGVAAAPMAQSEGDWSVGKASDAGHPLLIRHLSRLPSWVTRTDFPKLVAISWKLEQAGGMPTSAESARIYGFEDVLSAAVETSKVGVLTTIVTANGVVEWQYYAVDHGRFMEELNRAMSKRPKVPIEMSLQSDPSWSAYERFGLLK
jgi:hypothetical protein